MMSEQPGQSDTDGPAQTGNTLLGTHTATCLALVAYGLTNAVTGAWEAWSGQIDLTAGVSIVASVGISGVAVGALLTDTDEFDGPLSKVIIVGVLLYLFVVLWRMVP